MPKLKSLLTEELTKFPGSDKIFKLFTKHGYKKYSHGQNAVGFVHKGGTPIEIFGLAAILKKHFRTGRWKGDRVMGHYTWTFTGDAGPYHEYEVSFDSSDQETVRNFYIKITRPD